MRLVICTGNKAKHAEFQRILGQELEAVDADLPELQSLDTEAVCRAKAAAAFDLLGRPLLVDDTGFELGALEGFPGALITWVLGAGRSHLLHRMLPPGATPSAVAITCIGLATDRGVEVFSGRVPGTVVAEPRGTNGFGFDDVFIPEGSNATFAQMADAEKDRWSPRARALAQVSARLASGY